MSLCFARCEFDCGVTLTHANYWIISVDSSTNPSQSLFNHFEDVEPLFRHMVPHSPVHARSRANFIKRASLRPKFCTEARDSVLSSIYMWAYTGENIIFSRLRLQKISPA